MKQTALCPKCKGKQIGRFLYVADETDATTMPGRRRSLWWESLGFFKGEVRADVEAYVCTECGYFEEYVKDPESVPWGKLKPFRWYRSLNEHIEPSDPDPDGYYR